MEFVANNGCNTAMFTGTTEPQQNKQFLATFALLNKLISKPFTNLEMQTTGLFLTDNRDYVRFLRNFVGINTIALSINSLDDGANNNILGHGLDKPVLQYKLCKLLKEYGFNIRCCFNLNSAFEDYSPAAIFDKVTNEYFADQVTFRVLYSSDSSTPQGKWIADNMVSKRWIAGLTKFLDSYKAVGTNVYGTSLLDVNGVSVFFDKNCIGKHHTKEAGDAKHFILCPNCKLYSSWDTEASLVF